MFNLVKGTHDVILKDARKYSYIEVVLERAAELYGYKEFRTPIIETSELFLRSVGDSSDIVRKEMYTFDDKGGRSITLRPEITAGTIRSMVANKLFAMQDYPIKGYYCGPCFRYERPQQGRYRQFNQFGVECAGVIRSERDAEVISMGYNSLMMLGFKNLELKINTLGDEETRANYRAALKDYFAKYIDTMCDDCKERFKLNILRILDCKVESDRKIIDGAPKISDYLTEKAKTDFDTILKNLDKLGIKYTIDPELVRGLDYYSGVVFEFHYTSSAGKNYGAIGAGGHYNNLVHEIGGPEIEGCGYAMGIERLASVMEDDNLFAEADIDQFLDVYIMPLGERAISESLSIANLIRMSGYTCDICLENKGMGQMFKKGERRDALYALIVGDNELDSHKFVLKNMLSQEQIEVNEDELIDKLDSLFAEDDDDDCCCGHDHHDGECCCGHEHHHEDGCCCEHEHHEEGCSCHEHHHDENCSCHEENDTECHCGWHNKE